MPVFRKKETSSHVAPPETFKTGLFDNLSSKALDGELSHFYMQKLIKEFIGKNGGNAFRLQGKKDHYVVADEIVAQKVLQNLPQPAMNRYIINELFSNKGIFSFEDEESRQTVKDSIRPYFEDEHLREEYLDSLWKSTSRLVGGWFTEATSQEDGTDVKEIAHKIAFCSVLESFAPVQTEDEDAKLLFELFKFAPIYVFLKKEYPLLSKIFSTVITYNGLRGIPAFLALQADFEKKIVKALSVAANKDNTNTLFSEFVKWITDGTENGLSEKHKFNQHDAAKQIMGILFYGEFALSSMIQKAFVFLASNPEAWRSLLEEVSTAIPYEMISNRRVNHRLLTKIPIIPKISHYLFEQAPHMSVLQREASNNGSMVDGVYFPGGATVLVPIYAFSHIVGKSFDPEEKSKGNTVFGYGENSCLGKDFSIFELQLVILAIAYEALANSAEMIIENPDPTLENLRTTLNGLIVPKNTVINVIS